MNTFLRMASLAATVTGLTLTATPALAASVSAATPATATARIFKPLVLKANQDLDFGTIVLGTVAAGGETVSMDQSGVVICGAGGLTCSGTPVAASYNVQGTNNAVVTISATASSLTNSLDGTMLAFTPNAPANITLSNSGAPGDDFSVGGAITIVPATTDGVYSGDIDVTVDY